MIMENDICYTYKLANLTVILTILNLDYIMYYNENYVFGGFLISTIYLQETNHNLYKAIYKCVI